MNFFGFSFFLTVCFYSLAGHCQNSFEPLPCLNKTFSVIAHIVRDYDGSPDISEAEIQEKISDLNSLFDSICIDFEICEFRYINNFNYNNCSADQFELMEVAYNESNRINLYFVEVATNNEGFATFGGIDSLSSGGIVALKSETSNDLAHLFGHYFGLYNTFHNSQTANAELADGSNCANAGDSICDTPADPFYPSVAIQWQDMNAFQDFIYTGQDANGDYFNPQIGNIMSNYMNRCFFTYGQYHRMVDTWLNSSQQMW